MRTILAIDAIFLYSLVTPSAHGLTIAILRIFAHGRHFICAFSCAKLTHGIERVSHVNRGGETRRGARRVRVDRTGRLRGLRDKRALVDCRVECRLSRRERALRALECRKGKDSLRLLLVGYCDWRRILNWFSIRANARAMGPVAVDEVIANGAIGRILKEAALVCLEVLVVEKYGIVCAPADWIGIFRV